MKKILILLLVFLASCNIYINTDESRDANEQQYEQWKAEYYDMLSETESAGKSEELNTTVQAIDKIIRETKEADDHSRNPEGTPWQQMALDIVGSRTPLPVDIVSAETGCPNGCRYPIRECIIKGNISDKTGEKIYYMPGQEYYNNTYIDPDVGERWFCTEEEAKANGWHKSNK